MMYIVSSDGTMIELHSCVIVDLTEGEAIEMCDYMSDSGRWNYARNKADDIGKEIRG